MMKIQCGDLMTLVCKSLESVMTSLWPTCLHQPTVLSNILTPKCFHDKNNFAWCNGIVYTSPAGQHQLFCMKFKPIFSKRGWGKTIIRSPRSPNGSLSICPSHLLQLYWTSEGLPKDFQRTSEGLPKDSNLLVYKSQPPGLQDLF